MMIKFLVQYNNPSNCILPSPVFAQIRWSQSTWQLGSLIEYCLVFGLVTNENRLYLQGAESTLNHLDPKTKEVKYNPKYDELYAPQVWMMQTNLMFLSVGILYLDFNECPSLLQIKTKYALSLE